MIENIIAAVVANTAVLAILGFLTKSIITHFLTKDIASFKAGLEAKAKSEIEKFKSNLEIERIRLQISYGGIFEKQASVIIKIFQMVVDFENKISSVITPTDSMEKVLSDFYKSYQDLFSFYEKNKILLPLEVEENFQKMKNDMYIAVIKHKNAEQQLSRPYLLKKTDFDKLFAQQDRAYEIIQQLPILKDELTTKLRALIGVS